MVNPVFDPHQYAELKPVSCLSYADAVVLREKQATEILVQVHPPFTSITLRVEQHFRVLP